MSVFKSLEKFKLPLILIAILIFPMFFGEHIPLYIKSFSYAVSLVMKSFLVMVLPFIVFSFLFHSLISLGSGALFFVLLLLFMVATSNFIAIMFGYTVGANALPLFEFTLYDLSSQSDSLEASIDFRFPSFISNEPALVAGILMGLLFGFKPNELSSSLARKLNHYCITFLKKGFLPVLPIFIMGFVFKLEHEQILNKIWEVYTPVLLLIVSTQIVYITFCYLIASNLQLKKMVEYIKNIIPATITGFSTISSAATMPITIIGTEKNLGDIAMARTIISATANIHTLGSAIGLTILVLSTMIAFGLGVPSIEQFFKFAVFYTIAKFAVAGIPGGVVIVVSPLLEAYLGFVPEMIGLITAIYMLFDPFGTATNVTCNGAFAIVFNKIYKRFNGEKKIEASKDAK